MNDKETFDSICANLKSLANKIKKEYKKNFIALILYGSWAKNEAREDSDIDLLVVLNQIPEKTFEKGKRISEKFRKKGNVSIIYATYEDFQREKIPLYTAVKKEGIIIDGVISMDLNTEPPEVKYKEFFEKSIDFERNKIKIAEELYKKELYSGIAELCFIASKHIIQAYLAMKAKGFTSKVRPLIELSEKYIDRKASEIFEEILAFISDFNMNPKSLRKALQKDL